MKRILSLILAMVMLCAFVPAIPASAAASISIGDYVQMGTYYGQPILWRCVDIDENGPLMLSDKIICIKPYDASGKNKSSHSLGSNSEYYGRQSHGSPYWADSNMRSWLNSTASAGNVTWLCGNPPDEKHVQDGMNEYDQEAGFLTNFSQNELNAVKEVTQKSILYDYEIDANMYTMGSEVFNFPSRNSDMSDVVQNYDNAYAESVTDKMFLLDVKQVNAVYNNRATLGDEYYIGLPTAECVANSEFKHSGKLEVGQNYYYWLRTPGAPYYGMSSDGIQYVNSDGTVNYCGMAYGYSIGVRPAFYLNTESASFTSGSGTESDPYVIGAIKVVLNGTELSFDQPPVTQNDRTLVPLRAIFEAMGATVDWDDNTQSVTSTKGSTTVSLTIDSNKMLKNGTEIYLDVPAQLMGDRTMVPVRAVAEAFGSTVTWDEDTQTVYID